MPDVRTIEAYGRMRSKLKTIPNAVHCIRGMLEALGLQRPIAHATAIEILTEIEENPDETRAARQVHMHLAPFTSLLQARLEERARQIAGEQILPALVDAEVLPTAPDQANERHILSFGCGDGEVELELLNRLDARGNTGVIIYLYDVEDYRTERVQADPRLRFTNDLTIAFSRTYDAIYASVALHHCGDPFKELQRMSTASETIVLIESPVTGHLYWVEQYLIDWVYNRGFHPGANISVPGTFQATTTWVEWLNWMGYWVTMKDLGVDFAVVPEPHVRYIATRPMAQE